MKPSIISTLLVLVLSLIFVACGGSEGSDNGGSGGNDSGEPGSIYGIVTDKATGESIINAGVELQPIGLKTVTGSDGQFEFNEVVAGTYTLFVTKTGYSDSSSDITVESGKQAKGDVQLEKLPAALRIVDDKGKDIDELDFGAEISDVSRQFNIFNDGYEKLEWELSFSAEWIKSVSKEGGELKAGGTQGVIVNIDRSLLESGENTTTIHVTSNDGNKQLTVKASNFECDKDGYFYNGSECVSPCEKNPCGNGNCKSISVTTYECECSVGYWDGSKCDEFPECDFQNITPCRDRLTNYIWSARAKQDMDWDSAISYCNNLMEGNFSDWTLPAIDILISLKYSSSYSIFGDSLVFWSSTKCGSYQNAEYVDFSTGYNWCTDEWEIHSVRCVR